VKGERFKRYSREFPLYRDSRVCVVYVLDCQQVFVTGVSEGNCSERLVKNDAEEPPNESWGGGL
jgi:hypothetical protein